VRVKVKERDYRTILYVEQVGLESESKYVRGYVIQKGCFEPLFMFLYLSKFQSQMYVSCVFFVSII